MRHRRSRLRWALAVGFALAAAAGGRDATARAQTGTVVEAAPVFQLPTGGRSLGMGQATVALGTGSEGLWWNPALIARGPREFGLHIARTFATIDVGADAAAAIVIPVRGVGAFALGIRYLDVGSSPATDTAGAQIGTFSDVSYVLTGTFAAPFGDRFAAGVSVKFLQIVYPCTGICNAPTTPPRTGALDLGAQYFFTKDSLLTIGAALRSVGFRLQITDADQADALPSRADVGIALAPKFSQLPKEARVRFAADVVKRLSGGGPGYRFGAEISWLERLHARGGYVLNAPTGTGPTLGVGFVTGKLGVDFAQARSDLTAGSSSQQTFLSLRYVF